MNSRYDKYLVNKYAPLYRDRFGDMRTTAMCWGFEVGDGWFDIIDVLSGSLCSEWIYAKMRYNETKSLVGLGDVTEADVQDRLETMKAVEEKVPIVTQVKEKFGGLRFYVNGANDEQYGMIRFAEAMSYKTCEVCGSRGKIFNDYGRFSTRCKEHRGI